LPSFIATIREFEETIGLPELEKLLLGKKPSGTPRGQWQNPWFAEALETSLKKSVPTESVKYAIDMIKANISEKKKSNRNTVVYATRCYSHGYMHLNVRISNCADLGKKLDIKDLSSLLYSKSNVLLIHPSSSSLVTVEFSRDIIPGEEKMHCRIKDIRGSYNPNGLRASQEFTLDESLEQMNTAVCNYGATFFFKYVS
jgi:hypothetical protein